MFLFCSSPHTHTTHTRTDLCQYLLLCASHPCLSRYMYVCSAILQHYKTYLLTNFRFVGNYGTTCCFTFCSVFQPNPTQLFEMELARHLLLLLRFRWRENSKFHLLYVHRSLFSRHGGVTDTHARQLNSCSSCCMAWS